MKNKLCGILWICALVPGSGYAMNSYPIHEVIKIEKESRASQSDLINIYAADFSGEKQAINAIDISADGKNIIVGAGHALRMWHQKATWQEGFKKVQGSPITGVSFAAGNKVISTNEQGYVFIWSYKNEYFAPELAFNFACPKFYANMIAMNDAGDRIVVGHCSKNMPIMVYARRAAYWQQEKQEVPIQQAMQPTALGWTSKDTIIAYGKSHENEHADHHVLMEWEKEDSLWACVNKIEFDENQEDTVLSSLGYRLTRREPMRAASVLAKTIVLANDTSLRVSSESYDKIMAHCADLWK